MIGALNPNLADSSHLPRMISQEFSQLALDFAARLSFCKLSYSLPAHNISTLPVAVARVWRAHTGPTHIDLADRPLQPRLREANYFIQQMEIEIARNRGVLSDDEAAEYEAALEFYEGLRERVRD